MDVDLSNFEKENFEINGFYRALVEDNVDPLEAGRVRVRILGIHPMDVLEAPTENLPWAEPVLSLAHSGGANVQQIDFKPGISAIPKTKYRPTPIAPPLAQQLPLPVPTDSVNAAAIELTTIPTHRDFAVCNSGTGGHFSVPAKGSLVWIFFDGGCHLKPQYFAMATQSRDWDAQKLKILGDLKDRDTISSLTTTKLSAGVDPLSEHNFTGTAIAGQAKILTNLNPPQLTPKSPKFLLNTRQENLSSWTSPGGTTIVSDHTWKNEQLYIMHKGYSHHIDENGQVTKIVGTTALQPTTSATALNPVNNTGKANDETEINAGLKNLYIVGDYNVFVVGNCFIQCQSSVQINAMANVGIVSRGGNVNVLAEKGNINLESSTGSVNIKGIDVQIEADNNILLKSKNLIDINSLVDVNIKSLKSILLESLSVHSNADNDFSVNSNFINMSAKQNSSYVSTVNTIIDGSSININGSGNIMLSSKLIESKASINYNVESSNINIKGSTLNVNGDGEVNILGSVLNAYGTNVAMIGGNISTIGGSLTTLTGITSIGVGTVTPASPATPVTTTPIVSEITPNDVYVEVPFLPSTPDIPIVATPSQIIV